MRKIGILTFHDGKNYGASLQCYALKNTLELLYPEANVQVINFKKEKEYNKNNINFLSKNYIARKIYSLPYQKEIKEKNNKFEKFLEDHLKIDIQNVITEENISKKVNELNTIIFGSDQIWNMDPKIYDKSKIFYGDFEFSGEKISYSASFGDRIQEEKENIDYIKEKLSKFKKISVREKNGFDFLNDIGLNSKITVDPTMLLNCSDWNKISGENPIIKGEYILYYSVNCRKYSWKVAKKLSEITGLKVINLVEHPKIIGAGFENRYSEGPIEFLNIIKNAKYVVTNSFHGTIFAILFKKLFIPVFDEKNGEMIIEQRKYSILKMLGIENIAKTEKSDIKIKDLEKIYECDIDDKLRSIVEDSKAYLKDLS